ncbi:MAG TPA: hypothetical protein VH442_07120 [Micromonosporaceae bacterium]
MNRAVRVVRSLRSRDPTGRFLRRALRAAVVIPSAFAIGSEVVGNAQFATFAAFGSFALLLFVEFRGPTTARLGSYGLLAIAGAAFVTLGTLTLRPRGCRSSRWRWSASSCCIPA